MATAAPKEDFWENSGIWLMGDEWGGRGEMMLGMAEMCQGGAGNALYNQSL